MFQLFILFCIISSSFGSNIVDTTHGKVKGKQFQTLFGSKDYYAFLGIPYAQPPVDELRFLPPRPVKPWSSVLVATKEKPSCVQFNTNVRKRKSMGVYGSEDCLYLNIFTPKLHPANSPVIVFLYNENFVNSYNKTRDYAPDFFIDEDIVVVTIEYRLSVFGFLSFEDDLLPGNSGLKDIVMALEWVKSNIAAFGADPDKITLMGARGGAAAVDLLIHSKAKHLFHAAILQSGASWSSRYLQEDPKQRAFKLSKKLGRLEGSNNKTLQALNNAPVYDLLIADLGSLPEEYFEQNQKILLPFGPIVEKSANGLLTAFPEDEHSQIDIPLMVGFNSREGLEPSLQYLMEPRYLGFIEKRFPFQLPRRGKFKFDPYKNGFNEAVKSIKDFYFTNGKIRMKKLSEYVTYIGDVITAYAVDYAVRTYSNSTSESLYYYHFDYVSSLNENKNDLLDLSNFKDGTWGAASGDELCYLFKCPNLIKTYRKLKESLSEDLFVQRKLVRMWSNFARYGNPTPSNDDVLQGLHWHPYTSSSNQYLLIGKSFEMKENLLRRRFSFWDNFYDKWSPLAKNGVIGDSMNTNKDEL